jgi:hypothetical protein
VSAPRRLDDRQPFSRPDPATVGPHIVPLPRR